MDDVTGDAPQNNPILKRFRATLDEIYGERLERVMLYGSRAPGLFNALYLPKEVSPKCNIRRLLCILPQDKGFPAVRMSQSMRGNRSARRLPWDRSIRCSAC